MHTPVVPGMVSSPMQPLHLGALNYLGQPITAGQMPGAGLAGAGLAGAGGAAGMPDLTALSAAYGMQNIPGLVPSANIMHPNQPLLLNNDLSTGMHTTLPSRFDTAEALSTG